MTDNEIDVLALQIALMWQPLLLDINVANLYTQIRDLGWKINAEAKRMQVTEPK